MAVESITARRLGNTINQIRPTGTKATAINSETGTLYVNAWSVAHAMSAVTRAHDALVRAYTERGDSTTWDVTTITVKIVQGVADPSHIGTVVDVDVHDRFHF